MTSAAATSIFDDPRWDTFGLLKEAYLAVSARIDDEIAADEPVDPALADLVFRLARTPDHALRGIDISRALSMTTTSTTRLLDRAEAAGLAVREAHPTDRRAVLVRLTPVGLEAAQRWGASALAASQRWIHDLLSDDEERLLGTLLLRLRDASPSSGA